MFRILHSLFWTALLIATAGCGGENEASSRATWLFRGGDINRASQMSKWRAADMEARLASSADLVTFQFNGEKKPLPAPSEMERLSRLLEAKLTEANVDGSRDKEYVGAVVDEVWPSIQ